MQIKELDMHAPKYFYDLNCHCLLKLNLTYTSQQDTQPKKKTNHVPNAIEDSAQQETHNLELSPDNLPQQVATRQRNKLRKALINILIKDLS